MCLGLVYGDICGVGCVGIQAALEVKQVRYIRRMLSVTSTLLHVPYLK
jgi:hypothetical protein